MRKATLAVICAIGALSGVASAQQVALGVLAGAPGVGLELTVGLTPGINIRAAGQGLPTFSRSATERDVSYDADLKVRSGMAAFDIGLTRSGAVSFSLGVAYVDITATAVSRGLAPIRINGVTYAVPADGLLVGSAKTGNSIAPYGGFRFGNPVGAGSPLRLTFDLGVLYTGSPKIELGTAVPNDPRIPASVRAQFYSDLEAERVREEDEISKYKFIPVIQLGLHFRF
ncbi:MAG: hypothetical protein ABIT01_05125 [Thermoanaerobaculia bacterium]